MKQDGVDGEGIVRLDYIDFGRRHTRLGKGACTGRDRSGGCQVGHGGDIAMVRGSGTSPPAQKWPPAPVSTTARTAASSRTSATAAAKASRIG